MPTIAFHAETAEQLRKMLEPGEPIYLVPASEYNEMQARGCMVVGHDGKHFTMDAAAIPGVGAVQLPGIGIYLDLNAQHALRQMLKGEPATAKTKGKKQ